MHSSAALQLVHESPHRDLAAAEVAAAHSFAPWGFHWIRTVLPAHPRGWRAATPSCSRRGPSI